MELLSQVEHITPMMHAMPWITALQQMKQSEYDIIEDRIPQLNLAYEFTENQLIPSMNKLSSNLTKILEILANTTFPKMINGEATNQIIMPALLEIKQAIDAAYDATNKFT